MNIHVLANTENTGPDAPAAPSPLPSMPSTLPAESGSQDQESRIRQLSAAGLGHPQPAFKSLPGETPRAFNAFMTWFQLGRARSHQAVADKLGEGLPTVKNWASKYDWSDRLLSFNAGLLQQQALDTAEQQRKQIADWSARLNRFREQEWDAAQKLLSAAQCFLETFGDEQVGKMTLSQVSRALRISSEIGRSALAGAELPPSAEPALAPIQRQMLDAIARIYGQAPPSPVAAGVAPAVEPGVPPGGAQQL